MQGWICIHRKLLEWEWYSDINTKTLFIHCLLRANHKPKKWQGIDVPAGSFITGRKVLSAETGLSEQQVRTSLTRLKSTSDITITSTSKYSLLTLTNWASYQDQQINQPSKQPADQPASNQQSTSNQPASNHKQQCKQLNNETKKIGRFAKPSFDDLEKYKQEKTLNLDSQAFLNHYDSNGWKVGKNPMKDWQATARNWATRQSGFGNQQPQQKQYQDFPQ
jgi:hypothetical protein